MVKYLVLGCVISTLYLPVYVMFEAPSVFVLSMELL